MHVLDLGRSPCRDCGSHGDALKTTFPPTTAAQHSVTDSMTLPPAEDFTEVSTALSQRRVQLGCGRAPRGSRGRVGRTTTSSGPLLPRWRPGATASSHACCLTPCRAAPPNGSRPGARTGGVPPPPPPPLFLKKNDWDEGSYQASQIRPTVPAVSATFWAPLGRDVEVLTVRR